MNSQEKEFVDMSEPLLPAAHDNRIHGNLLK